MNENNIDIENIINKLNEKEKVILIEQKKNSEKLNNLSKKERTHRLIKQGLLIDFANLSNFSLATILGYLLDFDKHKNNKYQLNEFYLKGKTKFLEKNFKEDFKNEENV